MKLYLGQYLHFLDERGRITLPRKIREECQQQAIILLRGQNNCIYGYDRGSWEKEAEKHLTTPITDKEGVLTRRRLFSGAEQVEVDKLGRILLPQALKEYAGITKNLYVTGAGDHFEIWNEKAWQAHSKDAKAI